MSGTVALWTQELETQGWALLRANQSPRLSERLFEGDRSRPNLADLRQVFDGTPMRVIQGLIGEVTLSQVRYRAVDGWHRGRSDTVSSGAPTNFIPGYDLLLGLVASSVEVISGSQRLGLHEAVPESIAVTLEIAPVDLVLCDSRLLRRWRRGQEDVFWFSVARPWLTPAMELRCLVPAEAPPRARQFYGEALEPACDVGSWLFRSHPRSEN